jgi:hypothetical protein
MKFELLSPGGEHRRSRTSTRVRQCSGMTPDETGRTNAMPSNSNYDRDPRGDAYIAGLSEWQQEICARPSRPDSPRRPGDERDNQAN